MDCTGREGADLCSGVQLAGSLERHDAHVRELFHLDRFVTLVDFNPATAKGNLSGAPLTCSPADLRLAADKSDVFESFKSNYDLFTHAAPDVAGRGNSRRTTRRAMTDQKEGVLAPVKAAPVASMSGAGRGHAHGKVDVKGKGKAAEGPLKAEDAVTAPARPAAAAKKSGGGGRSKKSITKTEVATPVASPSTSAPKAKSKSRRSSTTPAAPTTLTADPTPSTSKHPLPYLPLPSSKRAKLSHDSIPTVYTHPLQLPRPPAFDGSLPALLSSYLDLTDDATLSTHPTPEALDAIASHDASILTRVSRLTASGRTLGNPDRRAASEPKRIKDHQEHLVEQVVHFSKLVHDERRSHMALAKKTGRMVLAYFGMVEGREERERKEEEKQKKALARWTVREVRKKWKMAVNVRPLSRGG